MSLNKLFQVLWCTLLIHCGNAFCAAAPSGYSIYDLYLADPNQKNNCVVIYDACNVSYKVRTFTTANGEFAIAYDRSSKNFLGLPLKSGMYTRIDMELPFISLPSEVRRPISIPTPSPVGPFEFDTAKPCGPENCFHIAERQFAGGIKITTAKKPDSYVCWQLLDQVVFGERNNPEVDLHCVAAYRGGLTFVADHNGHVPHSILLPGNKKKPVMGVEKTPNTTGTNYLEKTQSPAPAPSAGFLVHQDHLVITSESSQPSKSKLYGALQTQTAALTSNKSSQSNANDGNDDKPQGTSHQKRSKKNAITNHYNAKPVYLSLKEQNEVETLSKEAFQNITARSLVTFGNTPEMVKEILDDINEAKSTASTVAEFKNHVADAKEKLKTLIDQHNHAKLQESQEQRDALIGLMQPVIADETATRAQTVEQEVADFLANILHQEKQARKAVEQSPAHQKYVADQLEAQRAAKTRLEFCENALKESRTASNKIMQEYQEFMKNIAAAVYDIQVELLVRNENGVIARLTDCKSAKKSSIQNVLFNYREKINCKTKLLCVAKNEAELIVIFPSFAMNNKDAMKLLGLPYRNE
jgi:hypothetical protein